MRPDYWGEYIPPVFAPMLSVMSLAWKSGASTVGIETASGICNCSMAVPATDVCVSITRSYQRSCDTSSQKSHADLSLRTHNCSIVIG